MVVRDRHAMWAVRNNPAGLTSEQRTSLAAIAITNKTLYQAYLLKVQLRGCSGSKVARAASLS